MRVGAGGEEGGGARRREAVEVVQLRRPLARRLEPVGEVMVATEAGLGDGGVSIPAGRVAIGAVRADELGEGLCCAGCILGYL